MIYDSSILQKLERKELELKGELEGIQRKIRARFILLSHVYIHSEIRAITAYSEGYYAISFSETTPEALSEIKKIESKKDSTIITLKSGEEVVFEEYFSKEAIASMIKIKQVIVTENYLEEAVPFKDL